MFIVVVGRGIPEGNSINGIFELSQAQALAKNIEKVAYFFIDDRSIKLNRKIKSIRLFKNQVNIIGLSLPIGGIPYKLKQKIKYYLFIKYFDSLINEMGCPDIIHIHYPIMTINKEIYEYLRKKRIKIVLTEHWTAVLNDELNRNQFEFARFIYSNADKTLAVSKSLANSIEKITNKYGSVIVCPNMVSDNLKFNDNIQQSDKFTYIFIGRITKVKRVDILIKAFGLVLKEEKELLLNIVGDGPEINQMKDLVNNLGISENVCFYGKKNTIEINELLDKSNVFVTASELETFGVPIIEAWMKGLPAIAANNIPIENYFSYDNGILFNKNNVEDLSEKMLYTFKNYDKYKRSQIAELAKKNFTEKAVTDKIIEIYNLL